MYFETRRNFIYIEKYLTKKRKQFIDHFNESIN